ncbi:MAG: hypothetical protein EA404_01365 [Spirochaetaceae bacterium]|nr:MAG: hypothetical protein EA404_01365 [Spirochaetaceae bacterium]
MVDASYYATLEIAPHSSLDQVKAAYHGAAKRYHPDLFPDSERDRRQLKMMKINEAYMRIVADRMPRETVSDQSAGDKPVGAADEGSAGAGPESAAGVSAAEIRNALAHPRDPAYTHYKLGFVFYTRGCTQLYRKDPKIVRRQLAELKTYNYYVLDLALQALLSFERAYNYFLVVVEQYPDSIWVTDARNKLRRIQRFNEIYQRICENTSRSLAARQAGTA